MALIIELYAFSLLNGDKGIGGVIMFIFLFLVGLICLIPALISLGVGGYKDRKEKKIKKVKNKNAELTEPKFT